jgi:hypothetical protein
MWLQQPEGASGRFEARTSEEAVRLARRELGEEAPVRCWKTRRGGVLGFFAREAFVAGVQPPAGAITPVGTTRPARPGRTPKEPPVEAGTRAPASPDRRSDATLSQLVERTSDALTLGSDPVAAAVFSEVLAEAEAAVSSGTELTTPAPAPTPPPPGPERVEGLLVGLAAMGVPGAYRPSQEEATLDGLVRALARLPQSRPMPTLGGSVIAVVGARREASVAAHHVVAILGLDAADVVTVDPTDSGRQRVSRRRCANRVSVVVVTAPLKSRSLVAVASWVEKVGPDYVVGAVPATAKGSDVQSWCGHFDQVDGLALSGLADTATPAELMGELPIVLLDGREATPLRWTLALLAAKLEHLL